MYIKVYIIAISPIQVVQTVNFWNVFTEQQLKDIIMILIRLS